MVGEMIFLVSLDLRWGRDGEAVQPACPGRTVQGKRLRRRKLLETAADSPASGACYVGQFLYLKRLSHSRTTFFITS